MSDIPWESSQQELQLCFRIHCNWRSAREVISPQICKRPSCGNFKTPTWESRDKKPFRCGPRGEVQSIRVEGGGFPQVRAVMSLVSLSCPWFVLAPKVLQLCTNHLVLVLCKFVWVVEACQFFLVPSRSSNTPLYPSKVLRTKKRALTPYSSIVFSLDSHLNPSRNWEHT